jgi:hypothetical protein
LSDDFAGLHQALEAATEIRPSPGWMAETPGTSVMVRTERSRPVTVALPPRRNPHERALACGDPVAEEDVVFDV